MQNINRLLISTIILSFLILIGAGEGKVIIGWAEFIALFEFMKGYSKFSFTGTTDDKVFSIALILLVGQIILLATFFTKRPKLKFRLSYVGVLFSIFSFFILTINFSDFNDYIFLSGIPFIVSALLLIVVTIKKDIQSLI